VKVSESMSSVATPVPLGTVGVWAASWELTPARIAEIERLGYGTLWIGGSPEAGLAIVETALAATSTLSLATGTPVINGVIVANTLKQAEARCVGSLNRGAEFARATLEMAALKRACGGKS